MKVKHGGNIYEAAKKYGLKEGEILDYSANINPFGIPNVLKATIISNIDVIENYPDPDYRDLIWSIAKYNNIDKDYVLPGNGATEIIFQIIQALEPKRTLLLAPTFLEYERALKRVGSDIKYHFLDESNYFKVDKKDFLKELTHDIDFIILCNPNNPTGQIVEREVLVEILIECRTKGINLMIDEAFIEFLDDEGANSLIDYLDDFPNLFIVRALTKFFAIPGLRLGYGLMSNGEIKEIILSRKEPWTINCFASMSAEVLLKDNEYIRKSKEFFKIERAYMYEKLRGFKALSVYRPQANYIFFSMIDETINLKEELINRKILIRECDNYVNLDKSYFRVAIKDRESNEKLIGALSEVFS